MKISAASHRVPRPRRAYDKNRVPRRHVPFTGISLPISAIDADFGTAIADRQCWNRPELREIQCSIIRCDAAFIDEASIRPFEFALVALSVAKTDRLWSTKNPARVRSPNTSHCRGPPDNKTDPAFNLFHNSVRLLGCSSSNVRPQQRRVSDHVGVRGEFASRLSTVKCKRYRSSVHRNLRAAGTLACQMADDQVFELQGV